MAPWRTLLLLDRGYTVTAAAEAVGSYRRETARIGKRYLARALKLIERFNRMAAENARFKALEQQARSRYPLRLLALSPLRSR